MDDLFSYLKAGLSVDLPKDRMEGQTNGRSFWQKTGKLRPFVSRHRGKVMLGAGLVLLSALLSFPQPLISRFLIDNVILAGKGELLLSTLLLLVALAAANKLINLLQPFFLAKCEQQVILDVEDHLLERCLRFPKSFFDTTQTGYLMSRLSSDIQGLSWLFGGPIMQAPLSLVRFLGGAALLFALEWKLALCVLLLLPLCLLWVRFFDHKMHALSHHRMEQGAHLSSRFQETLAAVPLVKAFGVESRAADAILSKLRDVFRLSLQVSAVGSLANLAISSLPEVARLATLAWGAFWVIKGQWTLGSMLAFQAYLGYVFGPAQYAASASLSLQNARASLERVSSLFDIVPEDNISGGRVVHRLEGEVEFRNVSFAYDKRDPVLESVSFLVRPGEHVAIVGPSGVGKTTLLSLILCFYKPTSGEIRFDGRPLPEFELSSLRRRIGYVSQSTLLLSGTIWENLCYGNPEATDEQVAQAARWACIHDFICGLPDGYQTVVGQNGVDLSEGQRQRLSIARALVVDPDILVMDEPASGMDSITEESIFRSLPAALNGKTLFIASHRVTSILKASRILLLNEKRLVAVGSHESLMQSNDYYRRVVSCQGTSERLERGSEAERAWESS